MRKITKVKALPGFRVRVAFSDGTEGIADLSELAGKGVFSKWLDEDFFNSVYVDELTYTIAWPGGLDLCPDVLYADIAKKEFLSILQTDKTADGAIK